MGWALSYGMLVRDLLASARRLHAEKLAYYEGRARGLDERRSGGGISEEAYFGTRLTLMRGITAEESYVRWCHDALAILDARS